MCNYSFLCLSIAYNLENFVSHIFGNCRRQLNFAIVFRVNDGKYQNILPTPISASHAEGSAMEFFSIPQFTRFTMTTEIYMKLPVLFYYRFTPNKIKQLLKGNELYEKGEKEERNIWKVIVHCKEPMKKRDLLTPDLQPFIS